MIQIHVGFFRNDVKLDSATFELITSFFPGKRGRDFSKLKPKLKPKLKLELELELPPCNTEFKFEFKCKFKELLKNSQPQRP